MDMIPNLTVHFPGKLVFGNGCLSALPADLINLGCANILLVTIEPLLKQIAPLVTELERNGATVTVDTSIVNEPSFADFNTVLAKADSLNPDAVVGIGGGSVLDIAKLLAALTGNQQSLTDVVGIGLLKSRTKKLICAPATSGTGSEVSPNAILVDDENQKKGIISPFLVPDMVYVDPSLTNTVPATITAATGLDALTHCLEAYTNKFAHPLIDVYAFEGMRLIAANIVKAVNNGADEEARCNVSMGSLLGGFCLGPVNTAAVHALAYPLGSMFHLAHGQSNAMLLPHVMKYNIAASPARYANVAVALGCERLADDTQTAMAGVEKINYIINECGIPARLRDVGITMNDLPAMAADAMKITRLLKNNPRNLEYQDAVDIYTDAY